MMHKDEKKSLKDKYKVSKSNIIEYKNIKSPIEENIKPYSITKSSIEHIKERHPEALPKILENFYKTFENPNYIIEGDKGRKIYYQEYEIKKYISVIVENDGRLVTGFKTTLKTINKVIKSQDILYKK